MKTERRQTNNVARLSRELRFRVYAMLLDGATYDAIRTVTTQKQLFNSSLIACQKSSEFLKYRAAAAEYQAKTFKNSMSAAVISSAGTDLSVLSEQALIEQISVMISMIEDTKDVKSLSSALKDLAAMRENRKIKLLEANIEALKTQHELAIDAKNKEILTLKNEIQNFSTGGTVDAAVIAAEMRQILGVKS